MWDVIVVGAGPGGTMLSNQLARNGCSVRVFEKETLPRDKTCGGGLPSGVFQLLDDVGFDWSLLETRKVDEARIFYQYGQSVEMDLAETRVRLVRRDEFDHRLAEMARDNGACIRENAPVVDLKQKPDEVEVLLEDGSSHRAKFLAGAGGALCPVRRQFRGGRPPGAALRARLEVPGRKFENQMLIDARPSLKGYGWVFPKQEHLNVGLGGHSPEGLKAEFKRFLADIFPGEEYELKDHRGHPVPFYTGDDNFIDHRTALLGDSAGLVDGLTGEGIYYALRSALVLAEVLANSLAAGENKLPEYERKLESELLPDVRWSARVGKLFYNYPKFCFNWALESRSGREALKNVVCGETGYNEVSDAFLSRVKSRLGPELSSIFALSS